MGINTYFKNIADAIRTKTGGENTITPSQMPDEILSIETGTTLDLTNITVVGLLCSAKRGGSNTGYTQIGSLRLSDGNNYYDFTSLSGRSACEMGGYTTNSNEFAYNAFNTSTSNKALITLYGTPSKFGWFLWSPSPIDCTQYNIWEWWTANDATDRDPTSFALYLSDGTNCAIIDEQIGYDVTTNRYTMAYQGTIEI